MNVENDLKIYQQKPFLHIDQCQTVLFRHTKSHQLRDFFFVCQNSPKGKLEELFRAADTDDNGTLSATEFVEAMSLPSVQHYMQVLEVKIQDCRPLFDILDDGDGRITIPEFLQGSDAIEGSSTCTRHRYASTGE